MSNLERINVILTWIVEFRDDPYPPLARSLFAFKKSFFADQHAIPHLSLESIPLEKTS